MWPKRWQWQSRNPLKIRASLGLREDDKDTLERCRNPLKIRASLGPLLDTLKMVGGSQSLKDQGKSRTRSLSSEEIAFIVAIP